MASLSLSAEEPQVLDQRQVWYTNLLLLGFDPVAQEVKTKVSFNKDMFVHINKKGMEVILHYLFNRLDSHTAYEEFRDCWPVYDKKQEAQFRKVCSNWLAKISKEEAESKIPRLSASLLMSPGGERFEQLMLRFTAHIVRVVCLREAKGEEKQVFLSSFLVAPASLRPPSSSSRPSLRRALQCHIVRHTQRVVRRLELTAALHDQWRQFVTEQVSEYRALGKEKRELESQLRDISASLHTGTGEGPVVSTPAADKARKNKMKMVRGFWKSLDEFLSRSTHEREVVGAVAKGQVNKYTIDAKDLQFQIPDMILPMYEARLREGTVGNTYEGGKLNLLSLLQLWNCALQMLRDELKEYELPSFQREVEEMKELLQAHRVNLATSQNLRASLMEYQQSLKASIERLEGELQAVRESSAPGGVEGDRDRESGLEPPQQLYIPPITLPSLGLDLLPPSPQKTIVSSPDMKTLQSHLAHLSLPTDHVSTPEAVHNISVSIQRQSRSQKLSNPCSHTSTPKSTHPHQHPKSPVTSTASDRGAPSLDQKTTAHENKSRKRREKQFRDRPHPSRMTSSLVGSRQVGGVKEEATPTKYQTGRVSSQLKPTSPRLMESMPPAHDILASQIAAAIADGSTLSPSSPRTPEQQIHSVADPLSALGQEAFVSHDKIQRTPISKPTPTASDLSPVLESFNKDLPLNSSAALTQTVTRSPFTPSPSSRLSHTLTGNTSLITQSTPSHTTLAPSPTFATSTSPLTLSTPHHMSTHTLTSTSSPLTPSHLTPVTTPQTTPLLPQLTSLVSPHTSLLTPSQVTMSSTHSSTSLKAHLHTPPFTSHQSPGREAPPMIDFSSPSLPFSAHSLSSNTLTSTVMTGSPSLTGIDQDLLSFSSPIATGQVGQPHLGPSPLTLQSFTPPLVGLLSSSALKTSVAAVVSVVSQATGGVGIVGTSVPSPGEPMPIVSQATGGVGIFGTSVPSPGEPLLVFSQATGGVGSVGTSVPSPRRPMPTSTTTNATVEMQGSTSGVGTLIHPSTVPLSITKDPLGHRTVASTLTPDRTVSHTPVSVTTPSRTQSCVSTPNTVASSSGVKSEQVAMTTPLGFSTTSKSSSFLLSSQPPTPPPFLDDVSLSLEEDEEEEMERETKKREILKVEGKGDRESFNHSTSPADEGQHRPDNNGQELGRTGSTAGDEMLVTTPHVETKPNGIAVGLQISVPAAQISLSPAAQTSLSPAAQISSPAAQISLSPAAQISSPAAQISLSPAAQISSPAAQILPAVSIECSAATISSPLLSTSRLATSAGLTSSPVRGGSGLLVDISPGPVLGEGDWRPLDVSGGSSSGHRQPSHSPSKPLNQSIKTMVSEKHQLSSNGGSGLFDEGDSGFLVPLSPHSDFSSED